MRQIDFPLIKVWGLRLIGVFVLLAATFWVSAHLFVPGLVQKTVAQYGNQIGYDIAYQDLSLSPLRLRIEIDGLHLAKNGGNKLLEFKKLVVSLKWTKLALGELGLDEIVLDEPKLLVEKRAPKGKSTQNALWNWQELMQAIEKNLPPTDPKENKKPLKISVDELLVHKASLKLIDASSNLKEELRPFSIKLLQVANYDKKGVVSGVRGQYDFNLGSLQLLVPGINKTVAFNHVAIVGGLDNPSPGSLGAQLDLKLDEGTLRSHWDLNTVSKAIEGKIQIENISLAPLIAMLPANKELTAQSGLLNANLTVKLGTDANLISGDVRLVDLAVTEKGEKIPLITWKAADIHQLEYLSLIHI